MEDRQSRPLGQIFKLYTKVSIHEAVCISLVLMLLVKALIHLFFPQVWINSRADSYCNQSRRRKTEYKPALIHLKIDPVSYAACDRKVTKMHIWNWLVSV